MSHSHALYACVGTSSGFTAWAFAAVTEQPAATPWLAFIGSVISTIAGLWIAERARKAREAVEAAREKQFAELLAQLATRPNRSGPSSPN